MQIGDIMTNDVEIIESDIEAQIALRVMRARTFIASSFAATATLLACCRLAISAKAAGRPDKGPHRHSFRLPHRTSSIESR